MLSLQTRYVSASAAELVAVLESQHHGQAERSQQDPGKSACGPEGGRKEGEGGSVAILYTLLLLTIFSNNLYLINNNILCSSNTAIAMHLCCAIGITVGISGWPLI